jgi:hypothetical protein
LGAAQNFPDANRIFARAAADLRVCFPRVQFSESFDGDGRNPDDDLDWTISGDGMGFKLELEMSNMLALIAGQLGQGSPGTPEIAVSLDITDTSPPKTPI